MKAQMVCLGLEPRAAGWKAQTNPMSYGAIPFATILGLSNLANKQIGR